MNGDIRPCWNKRAWNNVLQRPELKKAMLCVGNPVELWYDVKSGPYHDFGERVWDSRKMLVSASGWCPISQKDQCRLTREYTLNHIQKNEVGLSVLG